MGCHFRRALQELVYDIKPSLRFVHRLDSVNWQAHDEGRPLPRGALGGNCAFMAVYDLSADG